MVGTKLVLVAMLASSTLNHQGAGTGMRRKGLHCGGECLSSHPPREYGAVAQLGERLVCNQEATGSIPVSSTKNLSLELRPTANFMLGVNHANRHK